MDTAAFLEQVEKDLLEKILSELDNNKIEAEKAQQLAKDFLALLPAKDKHDLLAKLHTLSGKYQEAQAVFIKYAEPYEEEQRQKKLHQMALFIKQGKIEDAIAVAKKESGFKCQKYQVHQPVQKQQDLENLKKLKLLLRQNHG